MELNLPEIEAKKILLEYNGANNYILQLKSTYELYKSKTLTRSQSEYIINNHDKNPKIARKWVEIDDYFADGLMTDNFLSEKPKSIWVEKILAESPKAFHIWGKILESQKLYNFWAPKNQIIPNTEREVDRRLFSIFS